MSSSRRRSSSVPRSCELTLRLSPIPSPKPKPPSSNQVPPSSKEAAPKRSAPNAVSNTKKGEVVAPDDDNGDSKCVAEVGQRGAHAH
jgi:hypothetical protein